MPRTRASWAPHAPGTWAPATPRPRPTRPFACCAASYFLAGAAITGSTITVHGCGSDSLQGDVRFAQVLEAMGAKVSWAPNAITLSGPPRGQLQGVDAWCGDIPDAAMTLAVAALFARGPTVIRDVGSWRVKETERMKAICTELAKLGAEVEEGADYCVVTPPARLQPAAIETYDDHRMAMAFSLAACGGGKGVEGGVIRTGRRGLSAGGECQRGAGPWRRPPAVQRPALTMPVPLLISPAPPPLPGPADQPITILDPGCTRKTFPTYFDVLAGVAKR